MNIFIFILLLILLILSAILIVFSSNLNKTIYVKKGGLVSGVSEVSNQLSAAQLYDKLANIVELDTNVIITIYKLNNGNIIIEWDNIHNFYIKDAKIGALIYGRGEALISNIYIVLNILSDIDNYLRIILIGNIIAFKSNSDNSKLLTLLEKHLHSLKKIGSNNIVHILIFTQILEFDSTEESITKLIQKLLGNSSASTNNSIYKLMTIFSEEDNKNQDKKIGGAESYTIVPNFDFIANFKKEIEKKYNSITIYTSIQENSSSLYNKFMYALIANNRNVKLLLEKPHTEKMEKGTIYFLPKKNSSVDISVFSKLGINNYTKIPLGEYYINNLQNVIKIE